jgi:hypothetical protein
MQSRRVINVVGCHAEGEVGDVIIGGVLPPPGATMFEKMQAFAREQDHIRRLLICEPRGSVARHVNLIVPSTRSDCVAGAIIMEPTEYPPMSGSNTMCVATALLETGMVPMVEPETRFRLDMPAGPVDVIAQCAAGKCVSVTLCNVPSFALALDVPLTLDDGRQLVIDIAYGGMIYALTDATKLGFFHCARRGQGACRSWRGHPQGSARSISGCRPSAEPRHPGRVDRATQHAVSGCRRHQPQHLHHRARSVRPQPDRNGAFGAAGRARCQGVDDDGRNADT